MSTSVGFLLVSACRQLALELEMCHTTDRHGLSHGRVSAVLPFAGLNWKVLGNSVMMVSCLAMRPPQKARPFVSLTTQLTTPQAEIRFFANNFRSAL